MSYESDLRAMISRHAADIAELLYQHYNEMGVPTYVDALIDGMILTLKRDAQHAMYELQENDSDD